MTCSRLMALALLALAAPSDAQNSVQTIQLYSFGYTPRVIRLAAGKPVTLTFTNGSGDRHDFTTKSFFAQARIVEGNAAGGEIELKGGESRSITVVPVRGRYKVHCGHFMHKTFGMTGTIVVD